MPNLSNDFEVRKETLRALGGDPTGLANIFEVDKEILKLTGGSGSGAASHESVDGVNYLTFVAIEDSTIKITKVFNVSYGTYTFEYSTDNAETWNSYTLDTEISLKAGENVKFRGDNPYGLAKWGDIYMDLGPKGYHKFVMTGKIAAYGSIMSLLSPTLNITKVPYAGFCDLFLNCTSLIKAPELQSTEIESFCYCSLFQGCTNLVIAPELPSTVLYRRCYMSMFSDCTSLVESPVLPATELGYECYRSLFGGCTNLRKITCYSPVGRECDFWHERYFGTGFSNSGTFVKAKGASWGIDDDMTGNGIPYGWTVYEVDVYKEAPMDGKKYTRQNAEWKPVEEGITDAPSDSTQYARQDGAWVEVSKVKTTNNTTLQFWSGTQEEYDAIATKDTNTLYVIS